MVTDELEEIGSGCDLFEVVSKEFTGEGHKKPQ
jgi:hypothetical protein